MGVVIAAANMKGGVGKTQTVHSLGYALAKHGQKVLLCDLDPQASLSESAGIRLRKSDRGMQDVLESDGKVQMVRAIHKLEDNLSIVPCSIDLAVTELQLAARMLGRETALKQALAPVLDNFDVILLDTAPSLSLLTVNSLVASNYCVIPVKPQIVDLMGLRAFLATLNKIKLTNPALQWRIVLTFYHPGFKAHQRALAKLNSYGFPMFTAKIGESVRVAESAEYARSIVAHDPTNPRAGEYLALSEEVLAWVNGQH